MTPDDTPPGDVLVLGGGQLGGAVARQAAGARRQVTVASPTERPHAGLWVRWRAGEPRPACRGATVILALSPGPRDDAAALFGDTLPRLALGAWRDGAAAVCVCGPAGDGDAAGRSFARGAAEILGASRSAVLRFGALVGPDDRCVSTWIADLRRTGTARLPKGVPRLRPLLADDAARAALALADTPGIRTLTGPDVLGVDEIGDAIAARFAGRWAWSWRRDARRERLAALADLPDAWEEARLPPRRGVRAWVESLPGLRRGR